MITRRGIKSSSIWLAISQILVLVALAIILAIVFSFSTNVKAEQHKARLSEHIVGNHTIEFIFTKKDEIAFKSGLLKNVDGFKYHSE